jgi:hypothetical protein
LYELSWDVEIIEPDFPPAIGAAIMALKELKIDISDSITNNLHQTDLIEK